MTKKNPLLSLVSLTVLGLLSSHAHASTPTTKPALTTAKPSANLQDGVIALVNDEIILQSELEQEIALLQASLGKRQVSPQQLASQALDVLIVRKIQLGIVKRAGITPNEAVINAQMLELARSEGFDNLTTFAQHLEKKEKGSYAKLRNQMIEEGALLALWQHELGNRTKVNAQEIDAFLASTEGKILSQDEYHTVHVRIPYPQERPTDSQKQEALEVANRLKNTLKTAPSLVLAMQQAQGNYPVELQGADTGYNRANVLPKELASTITNLQVGEISNSIITTAGVEVVMLVDKRVGGQVLLPEWNTSHILVKVDANQSDAIASQKINELYAALQRGANFDELAATYSDDTGSASKKGGLDWVYEGQMVPEFEAMMKKTEKGDFSTPFKTQFGYHILKVNDTRQRDVTDAYRRNRAEEILKTRLAPQAQEDWVQELKSSAYIKFIE